MPNEAELGAEFDVSRTALREGIKVLTAKGLLASRTRTGTRVRPRSEWNMLDPDILSWRMEAEAFSDFAQDIYEFRRATEPMAASLAALRASEEQFSAMEKALDEMESAGADLKASIEADAKFHQVILEASGNALLGSLGAVIELALTFTYQVCELEHRLECLSAHRKVLRAMRARDSAGANQAMLALFDQIYNYCIESACSQEKTKKRSA